MFYSHQILARKGPLATVWMAAHLHHRLKKPHYNSVDINSTIDRIIWPEAPIALRMSGHLLLGVVRIYSKKVDYLYIDCNDAMVKVSKVFMPVEESVNEGMVKALVDDVTLPERYELDAVNLDDFVFGAGDKDSFITNPEDITLPDSTPINMDHYVAFTFEDIDMTPMGSDLRGLDSGRERGMSQSATANGTDSYGGAGTGNETELASERLLRVSGSGFRAMEEDPPANINEHLKEASVAEQTGTPERQMFLDPQPSYQPEERVERMYGHQSPQSIEVMRHAVLDSTLPDLPLPYQASEQQKTDTSDKEKEFASPRGAHLLDSGEQPPSFQLQSEPMDAFLSKETPNLLGSHLSFGQGSLELFIKSTPSVPQVHLPLVEVAPRRGKRKLYDEKAVVLGNKVLKDALSDTSKIMRKKRRLPDNCVDSWRLERITRKEQMFADPMLTGMSEDLHDTYLDLSAKPHLANNEPLQETMDLDHHTIQIVPQPDATQGAAAQQGDVQTCDDSNIPTEPEGDSLRSPDGHAIPALHRGDEHSPRNTSNNGSGHGEKGIESPVPPTELDMEVERLRRDEGDVGTSVIPEYTPSIAASFSPKRGDDMPTVSAGSPKSVQEGQSTFGRGLFTTPDLASSAETFGNYTSATTDPHQIQQPNFNDASELMKSPGTDELHFLDADSSVLGTPGTRDTSSLSVRTRCVAQYLKDRSPGTPSSGDNSGIVNLTAILQNQPRKRCARMFYETLVLKTCKLLDIEQNESYGDITLKLTSALKAQL